MIDYKVFGLGLNRTGTQSLCDALNILGVKTIHYPSDERTFEELKAGNYKLSVLEEYDGAVDTPIAPYYAQLDPLYPGSKFIITIRDGESWLRSCQKHFEEFLPEWVSRRPEFKEYVDFINACVYGTHTFNASRFGYVYATHLRNVIEYFARESFDLLVMNICAGEGWEKLCPFLELPIPDEPFPLSNTAEDLQRKINQWEM